MPAAVYAHDIESYVGDDKARGVITYFDGMVMEVLAYRLVNRPGSSTTTLVYLNASEDPYSRQDEGNGQQRAASYHRLWRAGARYFQVWGKTSLGVWKAEGGVQKLHDPARARS